MVAEELGELLPGPFPDAIQRLVFEEIHVRLGQDEHEVGPVVEASQLFAFDFGKLHADGFIGAFVQQKLDPGYGGLRPGGHVGEILGRPEIGEVAFPDGDRSDIGGGHRGWRRHEGLRSGLGEQQSREQAKQQNPPLGKTG